MLQGCAVTAVVVVKPPRLWPRIGVRGPEQSPPPVVSVPFFAGRGFSPAVSGLQPGPRGLKAVPAPAVVTGVDVMSHSGALA